MRCRLITLLFFLLAGFTACQDELRERYQNPSSDIKPTIGEFFTAMLNNNRVRPSYWEISTFVNWHIGVYSQSVGYLNSLSMYQQNESYIEDRWEDYYRPGPNGAGVIANIREIEKAYNLLSETEKKDAEVFVKAAKVVLYEQTSQMVDLWGDIPFSEAGGLNSSGEIVYAKFDSAVEIYSTMLEDLKSISDFFSNVNLSQSVQATFSKQDILLEGNVEMWQRYTNSLLLRFLMRLSYVQEENSKNDVLQILNNESQFPLLNTENYAPDHDDILLTPLLTYTDDLHHAFLDWINYPAPYYILENVLKPVNDLRIPVLYDKYGVTTNGDFTPNSEFNALPLTLKATDQQANLEHYAIIDSATFLFNTKLPGVLITASEINFLKAEAYERWGGGDPEQEYFKGIKNSIIFYYYLNSLNTIHFNPLATRTDQEINNFLSSADSLQYTGSSTERLQKIWIQKWVHFGFLQSVQSWSEIRRTGYPQLLFTPTLREGYELPPNRLTYPDSEKNFNENYKTVASGDLRDAKIFWDVK